MSGIRRRDLLKGTALTLVGTAAGATVLPDSLPWHPDAGTPPQPVTESGWTYFSPEEAAAVETIVDRLIPPDPQTPGGKNAGCAVFIDRQLAGPYGRFEGLYNRPPFLKGAKQQGPQSSQTPAELYRQAIASLERYCHDTDGKSFAALPASRQDDILHGLESGAVRLEGVEGSTFFQLVLKDTQEGFFADPVYGGNRDLCAWRMIGFPGTRYDYRDWVGRHNERYPHPPVGLAGRPEWGKDRS